MQILPIAKVSVIESWDCDITIGCYDPGDGTGQYADFNDCESQCILDSWDCDTTTGGCYDPGDGTGQYADISDCEVQCIAESWECDTTIGCYDPGDGTGQYISFNDCDSQCILDSWDCDVMPDGSFSCVDPGDGTGQYADFNDCQLECSDLKTIKITKVFDTNCNGQWDSGEGVVENFQFGWDSDISFGNNIIETIKMVRHILFFLIRLIMLSYGRSLQEMIYNGVAYEVLYYDELSDIWFQIIRVLIIMK